MITGAHFLFLTDDPEADRAFLRDTLGFKTVDAGDGWLIFRLPPSELAVHPARRPFVTAPADGKMLGALLYLMCDDLTRARAELKRRRVACSKVHTEPWGRSTTFRLPSGGRVGLYEPTHRTAIARRGARR